MIVNLKDALAAGLILSPGKSREELCDGGGVPGSVPGLYVEARATSPGEGTYYYRFKNSAGKNRHERIGKTTEITLAVARKKALEIKAGVTLGTEPRSEKLVKQDELTLGELFHQHYWKYIQDRKKSALRDWQLFGRVEPVLGKTKLSAIARRDLEIFHASLLKEGLAKATCNLHLRLIRHMLYLAVDWEMLDKNPAAKIKLFPERNQINNYMDQATLQKFLAAVQAHDNPMTKAAILYMLSTAARTQEALNAKWVNIDLENRTWFIPAENAKSGKSRTVPLSDSALSALALTGTKDKHEYVFVNESTGNRYLGIRAPFSRIKLAANLPKLRPHDMRHQAISMLCANGASANLAMTLAGHASIQTTQRYMHVTGDEILRFVNVNASQIQNALAAPVDMEKAQPDTTAVGATDAV